MNAKFKDQLRSIREFCPECNIRVRAEIVPDLLGGSREVRVYCPSDECGFSEKPFAEAADG